MQDYTSRRRVQRRRSKPAVGMISLGCPKNLVDSEAMLARIGQSGYVLSPDASQCDVLIINTCGFIGSARAEAISTIREMADHKRGRLRSLIVTGCLAQDWKEKLMDKMPEIDAIVGTGNTDQISNVIAKTLNGDKVVAVSKPGGVLSPQARLLTTPQHYAYLKISEGCSSGCTYCIIPKLRGEQQSRPMDEIVIEAQQLVEMGVRELIVIAQDTGAYGKDIGLDNGLARLVTKLSNVNGVTWVRLMYVNPAGVTPELINVMRESEVVCDYLDMPIQHGSDKILRLMGRNGASEIKRAVATIREHDYDPALRTSLLVGFPQETDDDIAKLIGLLNDVQFDYAGIFRYSRQKNTRAAAMRGRVSPSIAIERVNSINRIQQRIAIDRAERWIGRRTKIAIDSRTEDEVRGRSQYQAPEIDPDTLITGTELEPGNLLRARVTDAGPWGLTVEAE